MVVFPLRERFTEEVLPSSLRAKYVYKIQLEPKADILLQLGEQQWLRRLRSQHKTNRRAPGFILMMLKSTSVDCKPPRTMHNVFSCYHVTMVNVKLNPTLKTDPLRLLRLKTDTNLPAWQNDTALCRKPSHCNSRFCSSDVQ